MTSEYHHNNYFNHLNGIHDSNADDSNTADDSKDDDDTMCDCEDSGSMYWSNGHHGSCMQCCCIDCGKSPPP